MKSALLVSALLSGVVGLGGLAAQRLGPPILCHPISIGDAKSLPMDDNMLGRYDASKFVPDTLAILKANRDPLVHMETLRRATMIIGDKKGPAADLLARLACAALDQESAKTKDPLPWFDGGFLVACFNQSGMDLGFKPGVADGVTGYAYILKAIDLARAGKDPQAPGMEFGAALAAHPAMRNTEDRSDRDARKSTYDGHLRRAVAGATPGSLLEQNLTSHLKTWGSSIEEVRRLNKDSGTADARKPK